MSRKKLAVRDVQDSLDSTVLTLADMRSRPTTTKHQRELLDQPIDELQEASRALPDLVKKDPSYKAVFGLIKKVVGLWRDFYANE